MRLIDAELIERFIGKGLNEGKFGYDAVEIMTEIHFAPTVDAEPVRRGKWEDYDPHNDGYQCSCCKSTSGARYAYCPYCGADMKYYRGEES